MTAYLQITFVDREANEFRCLGGAGFPTMTETRRRFRAIPAVMDSDIVLDLLDRAWAAAGVTREQIAHMAAAGVRLAAVPEGEP